MITENNTLDLYFKHITKHAQPWELVFFKLPISSVC